VCVVGAVNADLLVTASPEHFTLGYALADEFSTLPGGKGLNTALTMAALAPSRVGFVGRVGNDMYGEYLAQVVADSPLEAVSLVTDASSQTGIGHVRVNSDGEYDTVVHPGANATLGPSDISAYSASFGDVIGWATNLETPLNWWSVARGLSPGAPLAVNLSPLTTDVEIALGAADLIVLNLAEASDLTQATAGESVANILATIRKMTQATIVITAGDKGAEALSKDGKRFSVVAPPAEVQTTVGAGDAFFATLTLALNLGAELSDALDLAVEAGSLVVASNDSFLSVQTARKLTQKFNQYTSPTGQR